LWAGPRSTCQANASKRGSVAGSRVWSDLVVSFRRRHGCGAGRQGGLLDSGTRGAPPPCVPSGSKPDGPGARPAGRSGSSLLQAHDHVRAGGPAASGISSTSPPFGGRVGCSGDGVGDSARRPRPAGRLRNSRWATGADPAGASGDLPDEVRPGPVRVPRDLAAVIAPVTRPAVAGGPSDGPATVRLHPAGTALPAPVAGCACDNPGDGDVPGLRRGRRFGPAPRRRRNNAQACQGDKNI